MNEGKRGSMDSLSPSVRTGAAPSEREPRTPEMIGAEIRMYVDAGRQIGTILGIEIGRRLVEAKELLNHGEWLPWLKRETEFNERSAQRYMRVFEAYGKAQQCLFGAEMNATTLSDLPISKALALIAIPESEREDFAAEVGAETISVRELEAKVRERTAEIEAEKEKILRSAQDDRENLEFTIATLKDDKETLQAEREEAENARKTAEETILRMKKEIEEIEARPVPVAYERDEKAIEEAVQAERERMEQEREAVVAKAANDAADAERAKHVKAEKEAKAKIAELEKEKEKILRSAQDDKAAIEKELKEAQAKAAAAEKAGADSAALQQQVETLKKQLSLAAPEVAEFKAAFDRAQDELVHRDKALHEIRDEEIKEKLRKAVLAMLDGFVGRAKE